MLATGNFCSGVRCPLDIAPGYPFHQEQGLLRPSNAKILSWEVILFQLARWPWVVSAVFDAVRCTVNKATLEWKITPKGKADRPLIHLPMLMPYILIIAGSFFVTISTQRAPIRRGYFYLTLFNILTYLGVLVTILACHKLENPRLNSGVPLRHFNPENEVTLETKTHEKAISNRNIGGRNDQPSARPHWLYS